MVQAPRHRKFPAFRNYEVVLIIVTGRIIANHNEKYFYRTIHDDFLLLGKICATSLPPLLLIAKEPDLGNTMVISAMLAAMILVSGIRWRFIFGLVSGIFAVGVTLTYIFYSYKIL